MSGFLWLVSVLDIAEMIRNILLWAVPVMMAVIFHEVAHGYAALRLGDTTARDMGRLTLNPLPHIDPMGTVMIPLILIAVGSPFIFGYAKPVPVNFLRLRKPKRDMVYVAAAGPATNLLLAFSAALLLRLCYLVDPSLFMPLINHDAAIGFAASLVLTAIRMLFFLFALSVVLALFNLFPVPPLDGGRIAVGILPQNLARSYARIEPFGMLIVIFIFIFDPFGIFSGILGIGMGIIARLLLGGDLLPFLAAALS